MKQIVMVNAHWSNRGDEAAIRAILDSLLKNVSDVQITVIFKEKEEICQFPYEGRISYVTSKFLPTYLSVLKAIFFGERLKCSEEMLKIMKIIEKADMLIYAPGGAVISDRFWWKKQLEYLFPVAYAEKLKIPVFFAAPSIGPFQKRKIFRDCVLKKVNKLCVRENISCMELKKQRIVKNVLVTTDSAFLNDIDILKNQKKLEKNIELNDFIDCNEKIVGITITDLGWHVEYGKNTKIKKQIRDAFSEFIEWLDKKKIGVLLIPQLFGNQNDREYLKLFQRKNTFLLSDEVDTYFQQYIISRLHAVVGMRYHSNIFAAKMSIPFVPIIYEEKMEGFVLTNNWQEMSIKLLDLSADMLRNKYGWLEEHYMELCNKLNKKQISWKNKARQTESEMLQIIKNMEKSR